MVGTFGDYTGIFSATIGPAQTAMQAWAASVNAAGGINGHPVKLIAIDTQASPTKAVDAVQQLIQQDKVIAIVGEDSNFQPSIADLLTKSGVPVIGGVDEGVGFGQSPNWFSVQPSEVGQYTATVALAHSLGAKNIAVLSCSETPHCPRVVGLAVDKAKSLGMQANSQLVPSTLSNYSSACLKAKSSGADAVTMFEGSAQFKNITNSCYTQGWKPTYVFPSEALTEQNLTPALNGTKLTGTVFPFTENDTPATEAFQAAMSKYGSSETIDETSAISWASGQLFAAAAKAGNLGSNPTPAGVIAGLKKLPVGDTLGGLTLPLNFTGTIQKPSDCWFAWSIQDGKFVVPSKPADRTAC